MIVTCLVHLSSIHTKCLMITTIKTVLEQPVRIMIFELIHTEIKSRASFALT